MKGGFASIGHQTTRQRTLPDGTKIKSRNRTDKGNHVGFNVWVNDRKFFVAALKREQAEEAAIRKAERA